MAEPTLGIPRPKVRLDSDNRAFWTGGAEGRLMIHRCGDCGLWLHPPQPVCRNCLSENVAPQAVSGCGTVESYTINHQPWAPGLKVPFVIARIALDDAEGVILTSNIVNCEPDEVRFGDPVKVLFEEQDGVFYPLFERVSA